jgi:hypothetical protein
MPRFLAFSAIFLLLAACENPRPLSTGQAASIADLQLGKWGYDWGPTWQVRILPEPDGNGREWIQVSYSPDPRTGADRTILVNRYSRWAKLPPEGYRPVMAGGGSETRIFPSRAPVQPGAYRLRIGDLRGSDADLLLRRALELDAAVPDAGFAPLFTLAKDGADTWILEYGRIGDAGIEQNAAIEEFLRKRFFFKELSWIKVPPAAVVPGDAGP